MYKVTATCFNVNCESDIDVDLSTVFECPVHAEESRMHHAEEYDQDESAPVEFVVVDIA